MTKTYWNQIMSTNQSWKQKDALFFYAYYIIRGRWALAHLFMSIKLDHWGKKVYGVRVKYYLDINRRPTPFKSSLRHSLSSTFFTDTNHAEPYVDLRPSNRWFLRKFQTVSPCSPQVHKSAWRQHDVLLNNMALIAPPPPFWLLKNHPPDSTHVNVTGPWVYFTCVGRFLSTLETRSSRATCADFLPHPSHPHTSTAVGMVMALKGVPQAACLVRAKMVLQDRRSSIYSKPPKTKIGPGVSVALRDSLLIQ